MPQVKHTKRDFVSITDVIDGPQSVVFENVENRLHTHKALLLFLLDGLR